MYQPIFQLDCRECDASPVVAVQRPEGFLESTGLCGRCFFLSREMVDWERWNEQPEATE